MPKLAALLVSLTLAAAPLLGADDPRDVTSNYETVRVAEGIYAFIAPEPRSGVVNGNTTVIAGDDGVLVVDSGQFPTLARRQIEEIRKLTGKPVRVLVNTHWHWDHNLANSVYREAFPKLTIISTSFTRDFIESFTPGFLDRMSKNGEAMVAQLREMISSGKRRDGTALTEAQIEELKYLTRDLANGIPELKQAALEVPDLTFERGMTIHLGGREVRVFFPGRANTAGDAVVFVPDAKVLVTGDLVVHPIPYATSAYPAEWTAALDTLLELSPAAIVPGHGPVQRDLAYLKTVRRSLQSIVDQTAASVRDGLTLEETQKRVTLDAIRDELAGTDSLRGKAFDDYFAASVVTNAYKQAKGETTDEAPFPRQE